MKKIFKEVSNNWKSGLAVAIVSVPLSLSFAIASGASPIMGLITSGWAGITAAIFGGSKFNVVSPAGAFAGILTAFSLTYGPEMIPVVTILAGIFMFIAAKISLQKYLAFIPGGAIYGFTIGIGLIIAGTQLPSAFGLQNIEAKETVLLSIIESLKHITQLQPLVTVLFISFFLALILLKKIIPKISGVIIVAPLGLLLGFLTTNGIIPITLETLATKYGALDTYLIRLPQLTSLLNPELLSWGIISTAITIAVIGIIETMLSAKVADGITRTNHHQGREMQGLSFANLVSGFFGGMPATGVLGPTVLNINSGATSRVSAGIKAIIVLLITAIFFGAFAFLPTVIIASILFFISYSMIVSPQFMLYLKHDKVSLFIAFLVAFITIYRDPATGVVVGSLIGLLIIARKIEQGSFEITANNKQGEVKHISHVKNFTPESGFDVYLYTLQGVLTYLNGQSHAARLSTIISEASVIIFRLRNVSYIDLDGVNALDQMIDTLHAEGKTVALSSISKANTSFIARHSEHYDVLKAEGLVFKKASFALEHFEIPPLSENVK